MLSGCLAVPVAIWAAGYANMIVKDGTATILLDGDDEAYRSFRSAAVSQGGTMELNDPELSRANIANDNVTVTLQKVRDGRFALVGEVEKGMGQFMALEDKVANSTAAIAEAMANDGYTIVSIERENALGKESVTVNDSNAPAVSEETVLAADAVTTKMVREVQAFLNEAGYDAGPEDGLPGKRTSKALAAYQIDNGLNVTNGVTAKAYQLLIKRD